MANAKSMRNNPNLRRIAFEAGRGVLISQWFTNGALGSTWLPGLSASHGYMGAGQITVYVAYCLFLLVIGFLAVRGGFRVRPRPWLVAASVIAMAVGDAAVGLTGLGIAGGGSYVFGMCLIGLGMVLPVIGYGEYYCAVGERGAAVAVCTSAIAGTLLLAVVALLGSLWPVAAIIVQVACIPLAYPALKGCWSLLGDNNDEHAEIPGVSPDDDTERRASTKQDADAQPAAAQPGFGFDRQTVVRLLPFLTMTLLLGVVFGFAIGLNSLQDVASPVVAWAAGMGGAAALVLVALRRNTSFSLALVSKALLPVLLLSVYLYPLISAGASMLACAVGCAGYMVFSIYYQSCCAALAGTGRVRATPLFTFAVLLDSAGVLVGNLASTAMLSVYGVNPQAVYMVDLTVVVLIVAVGMFFLGDRETASLWGFKPDTTPQAEAEARCLEIAAKHGLTLREAEVMTLLATGTDPFEAAKELGISVTTVRTHTRNIYAKLDVHSQHELIRMALFE